MTSQRVRELALGFLKSSLADKGLAMAAVDDHSQLLGPELGIDSLDLATVVVQLIEATGKDPFAGGFIEFTTFGELVQLFAD